MVNGTATCYGSATLFVDVLPEDPVYIPNAITPNGDGNNDVFFIYGRDIKTVNLQIFNRWGEKVFDSNNQWLGWDGTYRGQPQNTGVFTYKADITFLNEKTKQRIGSLTLIR
jgi:gliding motility-associated-like protein